MRRYRENTPRPFTLSVPAPEFSNGDFSKLVNGAGQPIAIYDPATGKDVNGTWTRQVFPNNHDSGQSDQPDRQEDHQLFPASPTSHTPGQGYSQSNQYFDAPDKDSFYNQVLKFDQQVGSKHHFSIREIRSNRLEMGWDGSNSITGVGQSGSLPEVRTNDGLSFEWVGIVSPQMVINTRVSFSRYLAADRGDANAGFDPSQLGFPDFT